MTDIPMDGPSEEFTRCWVSAMRHLENISQGGMYWIKANLEPPFLEHMSFPLGNQLFFVRVEDVEGRLAVPAGRNGLLAVSEDLKGHPCLMPMQWLGGEWKPFLPGWGLVNLRDGRPVDPPALITDEKIEMTDREVHDCAVRSVRLQMEALGLQIMSSQNNPAVDPSMWVVGDDGPEWAVVRAVRYPAEHAQRPTDWDTIEKNCRPLSSKGSFVSVRLVPVDAEGNLQSRPLWRGYPINMQFQVETSSGCSGAENSRLS